MEKTDIINAYLEIRKTNNTIPDEVLDFMKDCAIQKLSLPEQEEEKIYFKCPYTKIECTEYDSGSATLLTNCEDCNNFKTKSNNQ